MKSKVLFSILATSIVLLCSCASSQESPSPSGMDDITESSLPASSEVTSSLHTTALLYKDLSANEILSATVEIPPRGFQYVLSDNEVEELVAILQTVDTGNRAGSDTEYEGENIRFALAMANGAVETIIAHSPAIFIENGITLIPYISDVSYVLSEFGKSVAEDAYQQFLRKIVGMAYASPNSITYVTTDRVVAIQLDENQSLPCRWKPDISDDSLAELIHDEIDRSGATSNMPGAGGEVHVFYFETLRAGECTIVMNYVYLEDDDEIIQTESYTIFIED